MVGALIGKGFCENETIVIVTLFLLRLKKETDGY
jgi:hypothetical protein